MGKYDDVELHGEPREIALEAFRKQIAEWGLTMPDVPFLVVNFGLDRYDEIGEIEVWVANEQESGYCGKFLYVEGGQTCPYHHHRIKHETFFVVKGSMKMKMNGRDLVMKEGDLLPMLPGTWHSFTGIGPCLLLEVSMPSIRGDNYFDDKDIGANGIL